MSGPKRKASLSTLNSTSSTRSKMRVAMNVNHGPLRTKSLKGPAHRLLENQWRVPEGDDFLLMNEDEYLAWEKKQRALAQAERSRIDKEEAILRKKRISPTSTDDSMDFPSPLIPPTPPPTEHGKEPKDLWLDLDALTSSLNDCFMPQLTTRLDISKIRAMRERLFGPTVEDVQGPNENPSPLRDEEQGRPRNVSTSRHDRKRRHIHETSPIHANGHEQQQGLSGRNVQKKEPRCPRERSSPLREELSEHQDRETIRYPLCFKVPRCPNQAPPIQLHLFERRSPILFATVEISPDYPPPYIIPSFCGIMRDNETPWIIIYKRGEEYLLDPNISLEGNGIVDGDQLEIETIGGIPHVPQPRHPQPHSGQYQGTRYETDEEIFARMPPSYFPVVHFQVSNPHLVWGPPYVPNQQNNHYVEVGSEHGVKENYSFARANGSFISPKSVALQGDVYRTPETTPNNAPALNQTAEYVVPHDVELETLAASSAKNLPPGFAKLPSPAPLQPAGVASNTSLPSPRRKKESPTPFKKRSPVMQENASQGNSGFFPQEFVLPHKSPSRRSPPPLRDVDGLADLFQFSEHGDQVSMYDGGILDTRLEHGIV